MQNRTRSTTHTHKNIKKEVPVDDDDGDEGSDVALHGATKTVSRHNETDAEMVSAADALVAVAHVVLDTDAVVDDDGGGLAVTLRQRSKVTGLECDSPTDLHRLSRLSGSRSPHLEHATTARQLCLIVDCIQTAS